jgi:hypothetical protein
VAGTTISVKVRGIPYAIRNEDVSELQHWLTTLPPGRSVSPRLAELLLAAAASRPLEEVEVLPDEESAIAWALQAWFEDAKKPLPGDLDHLRRAFSGPQ